MTSTPLPKHCKRLYQLSDWSQDCRSGPTNTAESIIPVTWGNWQLSSIYHAISRNNEVFDN